jgi:hypothetical protein
MKKKKVSNSFRSSRYVKVRQRGKKDPITIEGYLGIEESCFTKCTRRKNILGNQSKKERGRTKGIDSVQLRIVVKSADWIKLWRYCLHNGEGFAKHFWSDLIYPAMKELESKKGPRRSKRSQLLVTWIKEYASFLYAFFSYWCRQPMDEWPRYLKKLAKMAKKDRPQIFGATPKAGTNLLIKTLVGRGTNVPYRLTRYCIEKASGEEIMKKRLRLFTEPSYFLKKYIHRNRNATRVTRVIFKGKSREEMANLAHELPLKPLFQSLKIL